MQDLVSRWLRDEVSWFSRYLKKEGERRKNPKNSTSREENLLSWLFPVCSLSRGHHLTRCSPLYSIIDVPGFSVVFHHWCSPLFWPPFVVHISCQKNLNPNQICPITPSIPHPLYHMSPFEPDGLPSPPLIVPLVAGALCLAVFGLVSLFCGRQDYLTAVFGGRQRLLLKR